MLLPILKFINLSGMNFKYYHAKQLVIFIIVLSIFYSWLSAQINKLLPPGVLFKEIWEYINLFSTVSLLFLTLLFIDKIGWKWKLFKWLINLPNLNGRYEGILESNYQSGGANTKKDCAFEIKQTASEIKISSYYGDVGTGNQTSEGTSLSEDIVLQKNGSFRISHIYTGNPDFLQSGLKIHNGCSFMTYYPHDKTLKGNYFNDRPNKGEIKATFKQSKLLHRLR
jgi:SMODS-associating 2TM, beta-strand rich effector domain